jgi:diacylglycerol kinase (ATP)
MIDLSKLINSFSYALEGLQFAWRNDQNLRIHLLIALIVFLLTYVLNFTTFDRAVIVLTIVMVITAEMINTAIEKMVDLITSEHRVKAKIAKDVSSAMVLVSAVGSIVVGVVIFLPYLTR